MNDEQYPGHMQDVVDAAVRAERERCANLLLGDTCNWSCAHDICWTLRLKAAAIREGE